MVVLTIERFVLGGRAGWHGTPITAATATAATIRAVTVATMALASGLRSGWALRRGCVTSSYLCWQHRRRRVGREI